MNTETQRTSNHIADFWSVPAIIQPNNFVYKSLSQWSFNVSVGCSHACRFCYVPSVSTIKQGRRLAEFGVDDPDEEWGDYVLVRPWDEERFLASLKTAERLPVELLKKDGNRAVMFCTTTDPYQVIRHADAFYQKELQSALRTSVIRALEHIRDRSTLNVRILTRSPLAKLDFPLFRSFGKRLVFGMSLPTLRNDLAKIYEPRAPAPAQRLATLRAAKEAGLHVYVAVAPTYPECGEDDLRETLVAVADLEPITVFHEPINIRAENVQRIKAAAKILGVDAKTDVFLNPSDWQRYAVNSLKTVQRIAKELRIRQLHLWPDKSLGSKNALSRERNSAAHVKWLCKWWGRISEWPT